MIIYPFIIKKWLVPAQRVHFSICALILGHYKMGTPIFQFFQWFLKLNSLLHNFFVCTGLFLFLQLRWKMRAHFYLVFFRITPKTHFYFFTSEKSSQILIECLCRPFSDRGIIKKSWSWYLSEYSTSILNLTISKISTKSHNFKICNKISLLVNHGQRNWPSSYYSKNS